MGQAKDVVDKIVGTYGANQEVIVFIIDKYSVYSDDEKRNFITDEVWAKTCEIVHIEGILDEVINELVLLVQQTVDELIAAQALAVV